MRENKELLKQDFRKKSRELREKLKSQNIMLKLKLRIKEEVRRPRD